MISRLRSVVEGLSAPFNSWMTFFGQFFDHGLDLVTKGNSGTVFIPLKPDDPLYVEGSPTNFMILTRATNQPGPDGVLGTPDDVHEHTNTTSPFVDQNQTYSSHPSHQVFLRAYALVGGEPRATGELITNRDLGADGVRVRRGRRRRSSPRLRVRWRHRRPQRPPRRVRRGALRRSPRAPRGRPRADRVQDLPPPARWACKTRASRFWIWSGPWARPSEIENYGTVICVGGGVGIAPIYPIARALKEHGNRVVSIIGARSENLLFWEDKMRAVSDELIVTRMMARMGARRWSLNRSRKYSTTTTTLSPRSGQ